MTKSIDLVSLAVLTQMAASGGTLREASEALGVHYLTARRRAINAGIKFRHAGTRMNDARADAIGAMYRDGYTLQQIGDQYGITRERVRQLLGKYHGYTAKDGGWARKVSENKARKRAAQNARTLATLGCTWDQYKSVLQYAADQRKAGIGKYRTPLYAFRSQRYNAKYRRIGWKLTFWQWWTIWQESGHWDQRGRGHGYVMSRYGDKGPYALGNVFIQKATHNNSNQRRKKSGLPIGVSLKVRENSAAYVAYRQINGQRKYLGSYKTPELAHAAYLSVAA